MMDEWAFTQRLTIVYIECHNARPRLVTRSCWLYLPTRSVILYFEFVGWNVIKVNWKYIPVDWLIGHHNSRVYLTWDYTILTYSDIQGDNRNNKKEKNTKSTSFFLDQNQMKSNHIQPPPPKTPESSVRIPIQRRGWECFIAYRAYPPIVHKWIRPHIHTHRQKNKRFDTRKEQKASHTALLEEDTNWF